MGSALSVEEVLANLGSRAAYLPKRRRRSPAARRPICSTCYQELLTRVVLYGGCIGPIGGTRVCKPKTP